MSGNPLALSKDLNSTRRQQHLDLAAGKAVRHAVEMTLEERYGRRSTILTIRSPVDKWHAFIRDPTYADAILDRLVHNAYRIDLAGDSLRRRRSRSTAND
jgi:DNA replication protein DnaC